MSEIQLTQIFSRSALGYLWMRRAELDPEQMKIINSLYNNRKKKSIDGQQTITYKLSASKAGKLGYGRMYGNVGSLEQLERECRGTICREFYYDIDMVNAHPVILVQFAERLFEIDLPEVRKYCENRDTYLNRISTDRDEAKQAMIKVMYGGKPAQEFLQRMYVEVRSFTKMLVTRDEYIPLYDAVKHEKNTYGSFLALLLQTEERKIMLAMRDSLQLQGWQVDVLAYDGVMIRKNEKLTYSTDILRAAEDYIKTATQYAVRLTNKEFEYFDIPNQTPSSAEVSPKVTVEAYNTMKEEFEKTHFYYEPTDTYARVCDTGAIVFYTKQHAIESFGVSWLFKHSDKLGDHTPFFLLWLKDSTRRVIRMIDFKPSTDPTVYVQPLRFAWETAPDVTSDEVIPIFQTMINIATNNNTVLYDYLLMWIAHLIQQPFDLPGTAIVLTGGKGAGKDTLGDFICDYLIGPMRAYNYTDNDQFFDKHDTNRMGKFFVKLEEADTSICGRNQQTLKARITASSLTVNPKGEKMITVPNFIRYMFTTNDAVPVNIADGERRFVLLRTDDQYIGNVPFWNNVRKVLMNPAAGRIVGKYLSTIDLSEYTIRRLPENPYYAAAVAVTLSSEDLFLQHGGWDGAEIRATPLFELYEQYCVTNHLPYCRNTRSFGHRLLRLIGENKISRRITQGVSVYYR